MQSSSAFSFLSQRGVTASPFAEPHPSTTERAHSSTALRSAQNALAPPLRMLECQLLLLDFIQLSRCCLHKCLEQRMRSIGPTLEFGMELRANHEGMIGQLGDFHQAPIR
jgi:hypothetical protein